MINAFLHTIFLFSNTFYVNSHVSIMLLNIKTKWLYSKHSHTQSWNLVRFGDPNIRNPGSENWSKWPDDPNDPVWET